MVRAYLLACLIGKIFCYQVIDVTVCTIFSLQYQDNANKSFSNIRIKKKKGTLRKYSIKPSNDLISSVTNFAAVNYVYLKTHTCRFISKWQLTYFTKLVQRKAIIYDE